MICKGCKGKVPIYGSQMIKITGDPDIPLCDQCFGMVKESIDIAIYRIRKNAGKNGRCVNA